MKNRNGFTLVELLAAIILLVLLGLIISPAIMNTIDRQKEKTYKLAIQGLMDTVKQHAASDSEGEFVYPRLYELSTDNILKLKKRGTTTGLNIKVSFDGDLKESYGTIGFNEEGNIYLTIEDSRFCAKKEAPELGEGNDDSDTELVVSKGEC